MKILLLTDLKFNLVLKMITSFHCVQISFNLNEKRIGCRLLADWVMWQ